MAFRFPQIKRHYGHSRRLACVYRRQRVCNSVGIVRGSSPGGPPNNLYDTVEPFRRPNAGTTVCARGSSAGSTSLAASKLRMDTSSRRVYGRTSECPRPRTFRSFRRRPANIDPA